MTVGGGSPLTQSLSAGVATFTISGLNANTSGYALSASYAAQGNFGASGPATGSLVVSPAATSISISAPTVTNPANASIKVTVSSSAGTPTGSVSLTVNNGTPMTGTLSGGVATFTLTSPSPGTYNLSAKYAAQGNFAASGPVTGTLTVNSAASTLKISPPALSFGTVYVGQTVLQSTTLTNSGTSMITFTNFAVQSISGDDSTGFLGVELCPKTLNAGKSCVIIMSFTADSKVTPVVHAANLVITNNATGSPQTIPMTATVINPLVSLSPSSLSFGTQKTGTTSTAKKITLTNSGTTQLNLSGLIRQRQLRNRHRHDVHQDHNADTRSSLLPLRHLHTGVERFEIRQLGNYRQRPQQPAVGFSRAPGTSASLRIKRGRTLETSSHFIWAPRSTGLPV